MNEAISFIDSYGIQTVCCTGDLVVGRPQPNEVIDRIHQLRAVVAQGVFDRRVAHFKRRLDTLRRSLPQDEFDEIAKAYADTRSSNVEVLRKLPRRVITTIEGLSVYVCHGSPSAQNDGLDEHTSEDRFRREREYANVHIVLCGLTHQPFHKEVNGTLFVNPGALGMSRGGESRGTFAVVDTDAAPWRVDIHEVSSEATSGALRPTVHGL